MIRRMEDPIISDRKETPVFLFPYGLKMIDSLAPSELREDCSLLGMPIERNDTEDGRPDHFRSERDARLSFSVRSQNDRFARPVGASRGLQSPRNADREE